MGEEVAVKMEEPKVEEMKVEEPKPSCVLLFVDLHCTGCAKKIEKSLMRIRGVEGVSIDMAKNEVSLKGIVDPQALCAKITKKTKRVAKVLSPLPPPEGEPIPQLVNSQVGGLTVVELNVNMHCEACAQQLKKKILKMRGVQTASTELSTGKVVVTGTMDGNKLVEYVYRRTKKQARIVPQPEPPQPQPQPQPAAENNPPEEQPQPQPQPQPQEKKEDEAAAAAPPPPVPAEETKTEDHAPPQASNNKEDQEKPKAPTNSTVEEGREPTGEMKATSVEGKAGEGGDDGMMNIMNEVDHENMKRMMYQYYQYQQQPVYVIERIPAPQLFSDENPNACCIL